MCSSPKNYLEHKLHPPKQKRNPINKRHVTQDLGDQPKRDKAMVVKVDPKMKVCNRPRKQIVQTEVKHKPK